MLRNIWILNSLSLSIFGAWLPWRCRYCQIASKQFLDVASSQQSCFVHQLSDHLERPTTSIIKWSKICFDFSQSKIFQLWSSEAEGSFVFFGEHNSCSGGVITPTKLLSPKAGKKSTACGCSGRLTFWPSPWCFMYAFVLWGSKHFQSMCNMHWKWKSSSSLSFSNICLM